MKISSANPVRDYADALTFLERAVDSLDQAHALLREVGMQHAIATRLWGRHASILDAVAMADTLLEDARNARCEYCCNLLVGNDACLRNECPSLAELRDDG